ncbi:MAG: glycosyltransferase, partial [Candidatus Pacearchaeota archaeon]|nr:glycosyltransferase [Candidatus Pacearchaeota archaeon]
EGGAPTLVVSEAMASGCLLICSEDSEQEILKNNQNSLIIKDFSKNSAKRIISVLDNEKLKKRLIKDSVEKTKELSLKEWSKKILSVLSS